MIEFSVFSCTSERGWLLKLDYPCGYSLLVAICSFIPCLIFFTQSPIVLREQSNSGFIFTTESKVGFYFMTVGLLFTYELYLEFTPSSWRLHFSMSIVLCESVSFSFFELRSQPSSFSAELRLLPSSFSTELRSLPSSFSAELRSLLNSFSAELRSDYPGDFILKNFFIPTLS